MACRKLQLQDYFRLIKPENNPTKYCGAGFTTDKLGNVTKTYYDTRGNVVKTEYSDGTISCTAYDANGRAYLTQDRYKPTTPGNAELQLGSRTFYNAIGQAVRSERLANVLITVTTDDTDITKAVTTATQITILLYVKL